MEGIHSRAGMKVSASQAPGDHPGLLTPMQSAGDCRCRADRANPRAAASVIQKTGVKVCDRCPQVSQVNLRPGKTPPQHFWKLCTLRWALFHYCLGEGGTD